MPFRSQHQRIPDILAIDHIRRRARYDASQTQHQTDEGEEKPLPVHSARVFEISREIGHVGGHGRPAAGLRHHGRENHPISFRARDAIFLVPDVACAAGFRGHGDNDCHTDGDGDDDLEDKEPLELMRRNEEEGKLDGPE